jgi:oligoendopeptidase F
MLALALLAALIASTGRSIDLPHYYSSSAAERAAAAGAAALAERLTSVAPGSLASPARLYSWLVRVDDVERDLQRADLYVYLRSEEDVDDTRVPTSSSAKTSTAPKQRDAGSWRRSVNVRLNHF